MIDEKVQIGSSSSLDFSGMEIWCSEVGGIRLDCVNAWKLRRLVDCRASATVSPMNDKELKSKNFSLSQNDLIKLLCFGLIAGASVLLIFTRAIAVIIQSSASLI